MKTLPIPRVLESAHAPKFYLALGVVLALLALASVSTGVAYANPPGFDQCANGSTGTNSCSDGWINGNLGSSKAKYFEGDTVPQRIVFTGLSANTLYTITFGWDIINGGKHSYDYLTTYNNTVTNADACDGTGISPCTASVTPAIPTDGYLTACSTPQVAPKQQYFGSLNAGQVFTYFGDVAGTSAPSAYSITTCPNATGTVQNTITLTFTTGGTGGTVVLAYGTHVGSSSDWGSGNSAANISGSSYHNSLIACSNNIGGCGQRDNQMSTNAVTPSPVFSTQVRYQSNNNPVPAPMNAIAYTNQFYDSVSLTAASASGGLGGTLNGTIAFFICGPTTAVQPCDPGTSVAVQGSSTISVPGGTTSTFRTVPLSFGPTELGIYCFRFVFTSSATNYANVDSSVTTGECVRILNITAGRLEKFKGVARAKNVQLKWTTLSELDVMGFNVWRSTDHDSGYAKINSTLIPAKKLGLMEGAKYTFKDPTALPDTKYYYKLEIVGGVGTLEWSDVIRVRKPPTPTAQPTR